MSEWMFTETATHQLRPRCKRLSKVQLYQNYCVRTNYCVQVTDGKEGCVLKLSLSSVELLYSERVVDGVWVTMAIDENGREELRD